MIELKNIIESLPSLKLTVDAHDLMAKKALGQNFLLDSNITDKIIRASLDAQGKESFAGSTVFEVGPGPGGLTRAILKAEPHKLTVIEMDDRCIKIMQEIQEKAGQRLEIITGDALKFDFAEAKAENKNIISNLPYNISVPLLTGWLYQISNYQSLTLMFQKEVADRICAPTRTKDYGRLSVLAQLQCKITKLLDLNPNCFVPAPKIWSSVLLFEPLPTPLKQEQIKKLEKLTAMAFGQRRKMIRQSLKLIPELEAKCAELGIALTARAEELTPEQFLELSEKI